MNLTSASPGVHVEPPGVGRVAPYDRCMPSGGTRPTAHEVLAAVLQIRDGRAAGPARGSGPVRPTPAAGPCPVACSATTRTSRPRCAASSRRRSTCARWRTSSSSRCSARRTGCPGVRRDRHRVPRPRPVRRRPGRARRHRLAPRRRAPGPGVRPRRDRRAPPGTGCAPSSPTPTSASRWRPASSRSPRCASTTPPRWGTRCRRRTCSACSPAAPSSCRPARSPPPGPAGGRPAALFRFAEPTLRVTDAFAVLRPPGEHARAAVP